MIQCVRRYLAQDGLGPLLVKAFLGSAGLRIAGMGFGFLVGVQLARGLGADGYGVYGLAMSIVSLLTVPTEFGIPQLLTREVAKAQVHAEWGRIHGMLRWSTRTSLALASVIGVGVIVWLWLWGKIGTPLGDSMIAGIVMVPIVALLSLRSAALRGLQQIVKGQIAEVAVRPALHSLLLFLAMHFLISMTSTLAMWLGVAAAFGAYLLADSLLHRALPAKIFDASPIMDRSQCWSSALPMAMTEGMRLLQAQLLILLLGAMVTMSQVGIYRMAASTAVFVAMPISLFNIISMPMIAKLHAAHDQARLQRMVVLAALGMVMSVCLMSLPFLFSGKWLLGNVFGEEFVAGSEVLSILCLSTVVNALFGVNAALLNMTGHQNRVTWASLAALLVLALLALPLIWRYGINGAAVANLVPVAVWNLLMWRDCRRLLGVETAAWGVVSIVRKYS